ncbi:MAG: hypothetical protein LKE64_08465 [Solobacterium sp.]|jgi:hypothetical protein|nr:hypothetical protein [Solobacterium sp.]MCH4048740.1 hypothetical protein [Solobacterium sp.]MCH4074506.1 hypothetical protein [Solobacterium sp.]MCI1314455.1 hypothetical protein [Solobacterium sp.]MCI1346853.1 hypothetical protein [Solobacterium sp.]
MEEKKKYYTKNTGYTGEEKKLIRNFRKCSRKEREILAVLVEKTAMHMTQLDDLSSLLKK